MRSKAKAAPWASRSGRNLAVGAKHDLSLVCRQLGKTERARSLKFLQYEREQLRPVGTRESILCRKVASADILNNRL